ncbi:MAG: hypothetical protein HQK83_11630 [Fibrobacteria bacterium]|nr:hypothetical protein [Fibrobacteria bacterium]
MINLKIIWCCVIVIFWGLSSADPFYYIRIGDFDGLGFGEAEGLFAASGEPANVDGEKILSGGDCIPDLNRDKCLATGCGDDFDLRGTEEVNDSQFPNVGVTSLGSSMSGSDFTDIALSTSYGKGAVYGGKKTFPKHPPTTLSNQPGFQFDFTVAKNQIDAAKPLYFNLIFGDYDVSPANIKITRADKSQIIKQIKVQNQSTSDGLIQTAYSVLNFSDVFSDGGDVWNGWLKVDFNAPREPYTAFDYVEISTDSIGSDKLPPPVADPPGGAFNFKLDVNLSILVPGADVWYRLDNGTYIQYAGEPIALTEDAIIQAFATKDSWRNSDTISEVYSKSDNTSKLQLSKYTGEPLGGSSYLTENDNKFIMKLTTPYATITSVNITITTESGDDVETMTITNPQTQNNALLFIDTVDFAVGQVFSGNNIVEAANYDDVTVSWVNPKNSDDKPSVSFPVQPAQKEAKVYFSDVGWNELTTSLAGTETTLYVVVEDAIFDPTRLTEYVVTLTNKKGVGNGSPVDKETYSLVEMVPGKYGAIIPVVPSPPVETENTTFQIRLGDELKVTYVNPVSPSEKSDIIGYGVPTQQPGQVVFTNADRSVPPEIMPGNLWDVDKGNIYLKYTDDYIAALSVKKAVVSIVNTDALGNEFSDLEIIDLVFGEQQGDLGVWYASVPLDDRPVAISADGKLQYYFKSVVTARVATHLTGTSERLEGDSARAELNMTKANAEENITMKDPQTGGELNRQSQMIEICVEDQVFSGVSVDTLLLDKVECKSSGDKIENVVLIQKSANSTQYCGMVNKREAKSGTLTDDILHCQDIDNISGSYTDPVYGTGASKVVTIMDGTVSKLQFFEINGNPITTFSDADGDQILVRLVNKTTSLYEKDTLMVKLKSSTGDTLDVLVVETSENSAVYEAIVNISFSTNPNPRNNILEGTLDPASPSNLMVVTGSNGSASARVEINSAYVPADKAWIVDGNRDGQADSIYIRFKGPLSSLPENVSSIDWNYEGAQGYIAAGNSISPSLSDLHFASEDNTTLVLLIPGTLDSTLGMFGSGVTRLDVKNPPFLTLPEGKLFQGQEVAIKDGIGAVVMNAVKRPSDNTYYKDAEGYLQKQPDTLHIKLSENIWPKSNAGVPWDSLFLFRSPHMNKNGAYPLVSLSGTTPFVDPVDSLTWIFIVDNNINTMRPLVDDKIFLNLNAPYIDGSPNQNSPVDLERVISGVTNPNPINHSTIFIPVIGSSVDDPHSIVANLYLNEDGTISPGRDVVLVQNQDGEYEYTRMWIKPAGIQPDGSVTSPGPECSTEISETSAKSEYPDNCLSSVQIFSADAYRAEVAIFDHLGKFVHQSVQYFGYCGELDNPNRRTSRGLQSWLVWNQEDAMGIVVGTGVYIWKVKFSTSAGIHTAVYRQGIVRAGGDPLGNCAVQ